MARFYFLFPSLPLFDQIQENSRDGLQCGAIQRAQLCRQLQTVHRVAEMLLTVLFPSHCHFSRASMLLTTKASVPWSRGWGNPGEPRLPSSRRKERLLCHS